MAFRFRKFAAGRRGGAGLSAEVDVVERGRARHNPGTRLGFGAPPRRRRCAEFGLGKELDPRAGAPSYRCVRCYHEWIITMGALRTVEDAPRGPLPFRAVSPGDAR